MTGIGLVDRVGDCEDHEHEDDERAQDVGHHELSATLKRESRAPHDNTRYHWWQDEVERQRNPDRRQGLLAPRCDYPQDNERDRSRKQKGCG